MEHKVQQHNGFGSGFMLGLIIGVVVTLLFTTKRGRELFKQATEQGLSKFSELEKQIKKTGELLEEPEDDYIEVEQREILRPLSKEEKAESKSPAHHDTESEENHHKTHRFFKKKS